MYKFGNLSVFDSSNMASGASTCIHKTFFSLLYIMKIPNIYYARYQHIHAAEMAPRLAC